VLNLHVSNRKTKKMLYSRTEEPLNVTGAQVSGTSGGAEEAKESMQTGRNGKTCRSDFLCNRSAVKGWNMIWASSWSQHTLLTIRHSDQTIFIAQSHSLLLPTCFTSSLEPASYIARNSSSELFIPLSATFIWTCQFNLLHLPSLFHCFTLSLKPTFSENIILHLSLFPQFINCYSVCKVSEVLRHVFTLNVM